MNLSLEGIKSERLDYREFQSSDYDTWLEFWKDKSSNQFLFIPHDDDPEKQNDIWFKRIEERKVDNSASLHILTDRELNKVIGGCGFIIQEVDDVKELEIAYWILPQYRNKGYASESSRTHKKFAFENFLSDTLISVIHIDNKASASVAMKNGMRIWKQTEFKGHPVNIFRITREEYDG